MVKETIIDNEFASLWYYPEAKVVHHQIKKYISGEQLRSLLSQGSELLSKNGAQKWLSDDRSNNALTASDSDWANSVWFPATVKSGWKYWALVQPEKVTGQMSMKRQTSFTERGGVTVRVFSEPGPAMEWLISL